MMNAETIYMIYKIFAFIGPGPFPAILDMPHLGGALTELRASLLANKGYVVMALAYHGYQDLPKVLDKLDLEYFEEAVTFLRAHPKVSVGTMFSLTAVSL